MRDQIRRRSCFGLTRDHPRAHRERPRRLLERSRSGLQTKLESDSPYIYLEKRLSPAEVDGIRLLQAETPGLVLEPWSRRIYPHKTLAAHTLGFVNRDNTPLGGVENAFNNMIHGRDGKALDLRDANGEAFHHQVVEEAVPGDTLQLTLDLTVQHVLEEELQQP